MTLAGAATAKVAGVAGTTIAPGVGTVVGITGGFIGGAAGSIAVNAVSDIFIENDAEKMGRSFNAMISVLICEYMLDENETTDLVNGLNLIDKKRVREIIRRSAQYRQSRKSNTGVLAPQYDEIIKRRKAFHLPSSQEIEISVSKLADKKLARQIQRSRINIKSDGGDRGHGRGCRVAGRRVPAHDVDV